MPILSRTITTTAPRDEVFSYLADFSNGPEWDPGQESSTPRSDAGPHVGQIYDVMVLWGDRRLPMTYEVTAIDPGTSITLAGEGSTTRAIDTIEVVDVADGGCAVTYTADIRLKGLLKVAEPFLGSKFDELADHAEAGIAQQLQRLATG